MYICWVYSVPSSEEHQGAYAWVNISAEKALEII